MVTPPVLNALLLLNPTDVYRLLNLTASERCRALLAGMAGVAEDASLGRPGCSLAALAAWIVLPLALASALFARRQL